MTVSEVVRLRILPKAAYLERRCRGGRPFKDLAEGRTLGRLASWGRLLFKDLDEGRIVGKTLSGSRRF